MTPEFEAFMSDVRGTTDSFLEQLLGEDTTAPQGRLTEAMRYAALNGGKRVRPALCLAAAAAVSSYEKAFEHRGVLAAAGSVELIHAYSLVHDDLPAMDDDDLRRGKPTTHIAFDEATAILAGDALQTKAFEALANSEYLLPEDKVACITQLAAASGVDGMCGGQMVDLEAVGESPNLNMLATMHALKTGALIRSSVLLGATASGVRNASVLEAFTSYANAIGLAFQVKDDILDATTDTETLGKRQGADAERNKPTYVSHLGLDGAKEKLHALHQQAIQAISPMGASAKWLSELTNYIVQRPA